jgi:hypothetical protein
MKKLALILLVSLVMVSACLGGNKETVTTSGKGLEITDFSADQTEVSSGRTVRLNLEVENQGGTTANDSTSLVYLFGSNLDFNDYTGMSWNSSSDDTQFKRFGKSMRPADSTRDLPADVKTFSWRLMAPELSRGQTKKDTFTARIYYEYETAARGTIWIYSEAEADAVKNSGKSLDKSSYEVMQGPVGLEVKVSPDPPIVSSGDSVFTIELKLSNEEGGTIYSPNAIDYYSGYENVFLDPDELNQVSVAIDGVSGLSITGCTGSQELIAGRDTSIICDATVTNIPPTKFGFSPTFRIRYGYYIDGTVDVTVTGR